jgi:outer membrane cobalamin receptor
LKNKVLHILFLLLLSVRLIAQTSFRSDTIKTDEVTISHRTTSSGTAGIKTNIIDSSVIKLCSRESPADLLSRHSSIFIKIDGMGRTASPAFRGTGEGHTQLAWNEINLNSPMLGQSDFALIPACLIDGVQIYNGSASMQVGGGGLGGIVNISTEPVRRKETMISLSQGIGSFGQYGTLLKVRTGSEGFQSDTRVLYQCGNLSLYRGKQYPSWVFVFTGESYITSDNSGILKNILQAEIIPGSMCFKASAK